MHFLIFAYPTVNYTFFGQTQTQTCQTSDTSRARQDVLISGIRGFFLTGNDLDHVEVRCFLAENFLVSFLFVEFCFLFGEFLRPQKLLLDTWPAETCLPSVPVSRRSFHYFDLRRMCERVSFYGFEGPGMKITILHFSDIFSSKSKVGCQLLGGFFAPHLGYVVG